MDHTKVISAVARDLSKQDFPDDFSWGVSTSATQIEGAHNKHGRGPSIWDSFSKKRKKIANGDTPFVACDFYNRYKEDIEIIKNLGIKNFRISFSWSRILPAGTGIVNHKGIEFYHRLIDACHEAGIEVWVTLYHWDLPEPLHQKGGWKNREIIDWFLEYVTVCINSFKGKIKNWMVLNEPMVFSGAGYFLGSHAPGKKGLSNFLPVIHHVVLCQAEAGRLIRKLQPDSSIGTTYSCSLITPYTNSKQDKEAVKRIDTLLNRLFIEPTLGLGYPMESLPLLKKIQKYILPGDEEKMAFDFDFIGIQNYTREVVAHRFYSPYVRAKLIAANKRKVYHTSMNWEVYPESIYEMIKKFSHYKKVKKIIITENGAAFYDTLSEGKVEDTQRINYLASYLDQIKRAAHENQKLKGYFVWSLLDNFEWAEGYSQRFGLVHVDFETQKRTLKSSALWFKKFLED